MKKQKLIGSWESAHFIRILITKNAKKLERDNLQKYKVQINE